MTEGPLATAGIWSTYPQSFVSIPEAFGDQVSRLSYILPQRYNIFPRNPQNIAYSANINLVSIKCNEKTNEIWLCPMTKTLIPTENSTTNWQHKNATKNFDYTTIAYRLSKSNKTQWHKQQCTTVDIHGPWKKRVKTLGVPEESPFPSRICH